jgi:predicted DNA-binding helix-hairpin-helix protein
MATPARPNLDFEIDPKLAWALAHRNVFPIDVNRAPRELLLRIPGIGLRTVNRILQTRRHRAISTADLRKLRVPWHRMRYFVSTLDHHPRPGEVDNARLKQRVTPPRQMELFELAHSTRSNERRLAATCGPC